jgi:hypothetical protein
MRLIDIDLGLVVSLKAPMFRVLWSTLPPTTALLLTGGSLPLPTRGSTTG